jgi:hypothetical protein
MGMGKSKRECGIMEKRGWDCIFSSNLSDCRGMGDGMTAFLSYDFFCVSKVGWLVVFWLACIYVCT